MIITAGVVGKERPEWTVAGIPVERITKDGKSQREYQEVVVMMKAPAMPSRTNKRTCGSMRENRTVATSVTMVPSRMPTSMPSAVPSSACKHRRRTEEKDDADD